MIIENNSYNEISSLVDDILSECNEDVACIRRRLSGVDEEVRESLLTSDLLNAWQVFYFYFEEDPGEDMLEYLLFSPASSLYKGVSIGTYKKCTIRFMVIDSTPMIQLSDDICELERFSGPDAFKNAIIYIDDEF